MTRSRRKIRRLRGLCGIGDPGQFFEQCIDFGVVDASALGTVRRDAATNPMQDGKPADRCVGEREPRRISSADVAGPVHCPS